MIKAVLFDLDDTLYLEHDYIMSGFKVVADYIARRKGTSYEEILEQIKKFHNEDIKGVFERLCGTQCIEGITEKECVEIYRSHKPDIGLPAESKDVLLKCRQYGWKTGIITDGRSEAQWNKIEAMKLRLLVDDIIVTDELGGSEYRKPHPASYELMLKNLGVEARDSAYIGDNASKDFITPNKMGMITIKVYNEKGLYSKRTAKPDDEAKHCVSRLMSIFSVIEAN